MALRQRNAVKMPVNLSFSGLASGTWYLGQVVYNDGTSDISTTVVNVK
jgi:hypothetical protein